MEETKTILGALKALFGVQETPLEPNTSVLDRPEDFEVFVDVKTIDGVTLRITEMAVGATVTILDGETETPAPDGEHTLETGEIIQTSESKIVEISTPEEDALPEEEMGKKMKMEEDFSEEEAAMETPAQSFATVEDFNKLHEANLMLAEAIDKLNARFETFAKAPSAEPVVTTTAFNKTPNKLETREERLKFFGSK